MINQFEAIIQYHIDKDELLESKVAEVRAFVKHFVDQTEFTKRRLSEIISQINYDTITPHEQHKVWPELEFWRGVNEYATTTALNYDGWCYEYENDLELVVKGQDFNYESHPGPKSWKSDRRQIAIKTDLQKYPMSLLSYLEYQFNQTPLFYAWIGYLWQEVEGYKCGIRARTVENSSIETFSLNDFLTNKFSAFEREVSSEKLPKIDNFFPRKLSIVEIYRRASQYSHPFNPYKNYWRYFEKGDHFKEIVTYDFVTGIRAGLKKERKTAKVDQITKHDALKNALFFLTDFTNQMIFSGYEEKLRPLDMPQQMHEEAFDFEVSTGMHWINDHNNHIPEQDITYFEEKHKIKLPRIFFQFLRLFNGRHYNKPNLHFPINDLYTVRVNKFFTLAELDNLATTALKKDPVHLWIGALENGETIGMIIQEDSDQYGKIVIDHGGTIEICDYYFEKFAKYAQTFPVQPEIFAAQSNDALFLKKRINEGWDCTANGKHRNAVTEASELNAHEALEVLLAAGARIHYKNYREMTHVFDEQTIQILDKYPME